MLQLRRPLFSASLRPFRTSRILSLHTLVPRAASDLERRRRVVGEQQQERLQPSGREDDRPPWSLPALLVIPNHTPHPRSASTRIRVSVQVEVGTACTSEGPETLNPEP
eukprot:650700-Rhodomonas_salina.1